MDGNIGSRGRLDVTVIGPVANMALRLETLTKQLGRAVLPSRVFSDFVKSDFDLDRVGEHPVRGFSDLIRRTGSVVIPPAVRPALLRRSWCLKSDHALQTSS
jgi:class 3 adenylate cyclase